MISRIFSRNSTPSFMEKTKQYSIIITSVIGFFLSIFLGFLVYHNLVPGKLSDITVSNGRQTVVFLQMSHIATEEFYLKKKEKIRALSFSGYTLLMEGVKPGTQENEKNFSASLGLSFTPTLYSSIASFIRLQAQDNATLFSNTAT